MRAVDDKRPREIIMESHSGQSFEMGDDHCEERRGQLMAAESPGGILYENCDEIERDRYFTVSEDLQGTAGPESYFKRLNPAGWKTLGYADEELMQRPYRKFIHLEDMPESRPPADTLYDSSRRARSEYDRLLQSLATMGASLNTARDLITVFRTIRDFTIQSVPCSSLIICLYNPDKEVREIVYLWTDGEELEVTKLPLIPVGKGLVGHAINTGEVVVCNDYQQATDGRPRTCINFDLDPREPNSILLAPMIFMGRAVGTIELQNYEKNAYSREGTTTMRMAANLSASAIENVRLLESERKKEEQLRLSQKLEGVGKLAGGIAHDFNNLLTAILSYSDLSLRRLPEDHPIQNYIKEIKRAGERAASLTNQLLAFSRKQILKPIVLDINNLIADTSKMLCRLIGEDIEIELSLKPNLGKVKADPGQIDQVLMNLVVNARDAMPQGGKIIIETGNITFKEDVDCESYVIKSGSYVMASVCDQGSGMSEEVQKQIFEPFFTTKEVGKGTGLGLSTVYGIVKQSGGYITVESKAGGGTTFRIYFPRIEEATEETQKKSQEVVFTQGNETLLIVEDEELVLRLAQSILEECGYKVITASNSQDALRIFSEHPEQFHLVLTDVIMPSMSGRELVEKMTELRPDIKVIYMSGYTDDAVVRHGISYEGVAFLQKPFTAQELSLKMRSVLEV
jgi:signal transduction histidine kinase